MNPSQSTARRILRFLVLVTALANVGGNLFILLFYRPILTWVGAPIPVDMFSFTFVCGFSFSVGVMAWLVYRDPERNIPLVVAIIVGKGVYAAFTAYFYYAGELHWFYRVFGIWDSCYAVICFMLLIHLLSPDLTRLNSGEILRGRDPSERTHKALILYFSMSGNGRRAIGNVREGLVAGGYTVTEKLVEIDGGDHELFQFPFTQRLAFWRIMIRAILRIPVKIKPLGIDANHDYDLIVVESQTWFVGISAPVEAIFQDRGNHPIFAGRDVACVNVCRGLWRRPQAMLVRWIGVAGGNVIGARAFANPGREPMRTFSLFFFLGLGGVNRPAFLRGALTPQFISDDALAQLTIFGTKLASRPFAAAPHAPRVAA